MSNQSNKPTPSFKGLTWHRNQYYSLFVPIDWHKVDWQDGRQGVIFLPTETDSHTLLAIDIKDLGTTITSDDLPYVSKGFFDGIKELPEQKIDSKKEAVTGKMVQLEARYSYLEDGQTRKRWTRVFYHETRQITCTAQGATVDSFNYWLPMFNEAMMTITLHNVLPTEPPV